MFAFLLASWSVLVPQYHAPDEPNQVDAVMRLVQGDGWPRPGSAAVTPDGVGAIRASPFGSRNNPYELTVAPIPERDAPPRSQRPAWKDLASPGQPSGYVQQMVQHPPLYYWVDAMILKAIPGGGDTLRWDVTIGLLRMISILLVAPLPLLAHAAARCLHPSPVAATVAALTPCAVPQLIHIGSSVNNDNLLIGLGGLVTVAVAHVLRGDTSARTACWIGLFAGLALLTKSFAVVLVPMIAAAYVRARLRGARSLRLPAALCGGFGIAAGGWWWLINIFRWHTVQPRTPGFPLGEYVGRDWTVYWSWMSGRLLTRWWGSIGWYEVDLPRPLVLTASGVLGGLAAWGILRARVRADRTNLLFMLWPTAGLVMLVGGQAAVHLAGTGYMTAVSGRYLFTGFVGIAVLAGAGAAALDRRLARWTPLAVLAAAAGIQWDAVRLVLGHFWQPAGGGPVTALHAMAAWSPWAPLDIKIVFGSTLALAALAAVSVARITRVTVLHPGTGHPGTGTGETAGRRVSGWCPGESDPPDLSGDRAATPAPSAHPDGHPTAP
ncbi:hypothetical protein FDG2_1586 [Candidatus Protofrankia californiensis]|uniref:Glycosyltransferase RgtA/B/C/D-like domain-containing protein n=1 Tax=Candidatus Protofrankia californiensis TaxID=1839754 RepID=A0A1C3NVX7_9ACTN|nr:hypothetical protein FDG2_1586 [Candidatus Protofrankia californiensis]